MTNEECINKAKKVIALADLMIETFTTLEEDKCWEIAIVAALHDTSVHIDEKVDVLSVPAAKKPVFQHVQRLDVHNMFENCRNYDITPAEATKQIIDFINANYDLKTA